MCDDRYLCAEKDAQSEGCARPSMSVNESGLIFGVVSVACASAGGIGMCALACALIYCFWAFILL